MLQTFSIKIVATIKIEFGEEALDTYLFLELINKYIIEPSLTTTKNKGYKKLI